MTTKTRCNTLSITKTLWKLIKQRSQGRKKSPTSRKKDDIFSTFAAFIIQRMQIRLGQYIFYQNDNSIYFLTFILSSNVRIKMLGSSLCFYQPSTWSNHTPPGTKYDLPSAVFMARRLVRPSHEAMYSYTLEEFVNHSLEARDLRILRPFYRHPVWLISLETIKTCGLLLK